jgi:hypothetical protein
MKQLLFLMALLFSVTMQAQAQAQDTIPEFPATPCQAARIDYAVQIASVTDPNMFVAHRGFRDVIDNFETEKVCLPDGKVVYRILIPAEDFVSAGIIHSHYIRTRYYSDAFIVKYVNGKRYN